MKERIEKVKIHFNENKEFYIGVETGLFVGFLGGALLILQTTVHKKDIFWAQQIKAEKELNLDRLMGARDHIDKILNVMEPTPKQIKALEANFDFDELFTFKEPRP